VANEFSVWLVVLGILLHDSRWEDDSKMDLREQVVSV